jgi:sugar O-acyltransferase (sialic acid O-acetyltransferase NeuD family)
MSGTNGSVVVLGAGGHAKVVISTLQEAGYTVEAVYDDNDGKQMVLGIPVKGRLTDVEPGMRAIVAIGSNHIRQITVAQLPGVEWMSIIHPRAYVHRSVQIGPGTVVFAGAVIQPDAVLGEHVIINTGATVDHDCNIDSYAHIAPGVNLAGGVMVGERAFVGIGSTAIPRRKIGARATVGAGSVVIGDVSDDATVAGVPARSIGGGSK